MNARTTAVLVLVLLAVGAAWWFTRGQTASPPPPPPGAGDDTAPFIAAGTLQPERIERVEIERPRHNPVVLERTRGRWRMTQPVVFDADGRTVEQLITTLSALADLGPAEPDALGDTSETTLTLYERGGETYTFGFGPRLGGGIAPIASGDAEPRLVADRLHDFFERYDPTDLLSKQLATPSAFATTAFTVTTPGGTVNLTEGDGRWHINNDPAQPALGEPIAGYIDIAGYLNIPNATPIERFVTGPIKDLAPYGLTRPLIRIDYESLKPDGTATTTALLIGSPTDSTATAYFASYQTEYQRQPVVFVLPAEFSIVMAKSADDFRDPRVFRTPPVEIDLVAFGSEWSLALTDDRGSIIAPRRATFGDAALLRDRLAGLLEATAVGYINVIMLESTGEPPITVTVTPTLGRPAEVVTFHDIADLPDIANDEGTPYCVAVREGESIGLIIPYSAVERFGDIETMDLPIERADQP